MDTETLQDILARQRRGRTLFPYYKDHYAIYLLKRRVGTELTVRELKQSHAARFLQKPIVRQILATCPDGRLTAARLDQAWGLLDRNAIETYRLTLGRWGKPKGYWEQYYYQTSRPGENLVVQLNFGNKHNTAYQRLIKPKRSHPFINTSHPVAQDNEHTLAWCRLDVDLHTKEALIEEVQNDWLRAADGKWQWVKRRIAWLEKHRDGHVYAPDSGNPACRIGGLERYVAHVLKPHRKLWAEAVLTATLQFLLDDLNIRTVYYHTHDDGKRLKGLQWSGPPQSLYTTLPKRFGFRQTNQLPAFLQRVRRVRKAAEASPVSLFRVTF